MAVRPHVGAGLHGDAQALDRVVELGVQVVVRPLARRGHRLGGKGGEQILVNAFHARFLVSFTWI
jgi:hypothetical protein